jgi:hypothetical protein
MEGFLYGLRDALLYGKLFHMYGIQDMTSDTVFPMLWLDYRAVFVFPGFLHQLNWDALRNLAFDPAFHALALSIVRLPS